MLRMAGGLLGFGYPTRPAYLNQIIDHDPANTMTVVGTGDAALAPPVSVPVGTPVGDAAYLGYRPVTGITQGVSRDMYVDGFDVVTRVPGLFQVGGFATFEHSTGSSVVGFVYSIEIGGSYFFSQRPVTQLVPNHSQPANMSGQGEIQMTGGSRVRMWVASNKSGVVTCPILSVLINRIDL